MQAIFNVHVRHTWNHSSITKELKDTNDSIGHFPTTGELRAMKKNGLLTAIQQHGGIYNFKPKQGEEYAKSQRVERRRNKR